MKRPAAAALNTRISLKSKSYKCQNEGRVVSYCEAVNYFLDMHATDDVIAESDGYMIQYTQTSNKSPTGYAEELHNKELWYHAVNYMMSMSSKEIFQRIVEIDQPQYDLILEIEKHTTVHDLKFHANMQIQLQHKLHTTDVFRHHDKMYSHCRNTGRIDGNVNNINWKSLSSIKPSCNSSSYCSQSHSRLPRCQIGNNSRKAL